MMNELKHHGIPGQKWGVKHGPPYPLKGGSYTPEKKIVKPKNHVRKNSQYDKKHVDKTLDKDTTLSTLSYDKNRTKSGDLFFATYDSRDKDEYRYLFNKKMPQDVFDENGEKIGTGQFYKWQITNKLKDNIKVASEDSGIEAFKKLYAEKRDFFNFVTDPKRMESLVAENRYKFKVFREAKDTLEKMMEPNHKVTGEELSSVYKLFNFALVINDGLGNPKLAKDAATQRARFFNELKGRGYSGLLDVNDALYGGFKAHAPVIIFDMNKVIPDEIKRLKISDKIYSGIAYNGKRILGL